MSRGTQGLLYRLSHPTEPATEALPVDVQALPKTPTLSLARKTVWKLALLTQPYQVRDRSSQWPHDLRPVTLPVS